MNIFALLIVVSMASTNAASAGEATSHSSRPVKTIKSEDGDVIDCVDIYDQPAFKDPRLKNHKITMNPSNIGGKGQTRPSRLQQSWHKSGACPQGTIPIARIAYDQTKTADSFVQHIGKTRSTRFRTEVAVAFATPPSGREYIGTKGEIDIWNPYVEPTDMSINYILVGDSGYGGRSNVDFMIVTGWRVAPPDYRGDLSPRVFVAFRNNSGARGCYNLGCGFIQTNNRIAIDDPVTNTSTYAGTQMALRFAIAKDMIASHWRVFLEGEELGYYPEEVMEGFLEGHIVQFGGIVYVGGQGGGHTNSQMASGHFPSEGEARSGKISNIYNLDLTGTPIVNDLSIEEITNPPCYDLQLLGRQGPSRGYALYYGGPGGGDQNCV